MPNPVDYYQVLGVSPSATTAQIKTAYRTAAKRAHPDAGGSPTAMQLVNEANAVLSDPSERRDYDRERSRPLVPAQRTEVRHSPSHQPHPQAAEPLSDRARREHQYRQALASARRASWPMIRFNAIMAILLAFAVPYLIAQTSNSAAKILLALLAFSPMYGLAVGIIFFFRPRLRLALATIGHRGYRMQPADRTALLAIALSAIPLAGLWLILFNNGLIR